MRIDTEIIQNILSICKKKPYQDIIIRYVKLSPQMWWKYEKALLDSGRISKEKVGKKYIYTITKKGIITLKHLINIHAVRRNVLVSIGLYGNRKT